MRRYYGREKDYAVVNILAHEWGHLVQGNLGTVGDSRYFPIQKELQADCFAGAFAKFLNEKGVLEPGDFEEGVEVLMEVSDPKEVPWFDPGAHGVKAQRTANFYAGWRSGIDGCSMEIE
jgi:predicted metalloprotease